MLMLQLNPVVGVCLCHEYFIALDDVIGLYLASLIISDWLDFLSMCEE